MKKLCFAGAVCLACLFVGCYPSELRTAATERDPATGRTPIEQIGAGAPSLVGNPLDIGSWSDVLQALVILGAAGFGYKEWRNFRKPTLK